MPETPATTATTTATPTPAATPTTAPLSGRRAQAARNDELILAAARAVFLDDPGAPISAVAERAGVGISALYRRYPSKDELMRKLCGDGLAAYIEAAQAAVDALEGGAEGGADAWETFASFMRRVVELGSASLTSRLAGTFPPTEQLYLDAARADELNRRLIGHVHAAGAVRPDVEVADLGLILEQLASVRLGDEKRTAELRRRYLALLLDGMRRRVTDVPGELPGPPPRAEELAARWSTD